MRKETIITWLCALILKLCITHCNSTCKLHSGHICLTVHSMRVELHSQTTSSYQRANTTASSIECAVDSFLVTGSGMTYLWDRCVLHASATCARPACNPHSACFCHTCIVHIADLRTVKRFSIRTRTSAVCAGCRQEREVSQTVISAPKSR